MAHNYTNGLSPKVTPQTAPILGKEDLMNQNNAGGYSFVLDKWKYLERFLILGTEGGTFYVKGRELTEDAARNVIKCIKEDGSRVVRIISDISDQGRAVKNDPAIFALALVFTYGNDEAKRAAINQFQTICRTGTHLFTFVQYIDTLRSWGRSVRKAIAKWYHAYDPAYLAYQMIKYKGRTVEGTRNQWTHRDVLRSAHVKPKSTEYDRLFWYATKGNLDDELPPIIQAAETLKRPDCSLKELIDIIVKYKVPHEAWPTELKNEARVWEASLNDIPLTALIRNLNKLTALGVLSPASFGNLDLVTRKITDMEYLKHSRVHPLFVLSALKAYSIGQSGYGHLQWEPVHQIVDALDSAFYLSFGTIKPTGKRLCLGIDVSGSMSAQIGSINLTCAECAAVMAMVTARVEKNCAIMGFREEFTDLEITPKQSLSEIINKVFGHTFGNTDCALPMLWATENKYEFDAFCVYTDNETWHGEIHPSQALNQYRSKYVPDAKLVVVGMTATNFSIADPTDCNSLDVVGFDTATPMAIAEFIRG